MKKLIATTLLVFIFTVFISVNTYSQTQEPVKTEQVKTHCGGHANDAAKTTSTDETKPAEAPKSGCAKATTKCPSTCPHAKAAAEKNAQPANTNEKRTPVPQK